MRAGDTEAPLVRCNGVTRVYHRGGQRGILSRLRGSTHRGTAVTALEDVSLSIGRTDLVALAGPSGSGKTTLLHLLAGLETPTTGTVTVDGTDLSSLSVSARTTYRRERVGLVFQDFRLLDGLSARANVALPLVERGVSRRKRRQLATTLLDRVGLGDRIDHRPAELSGGEQQRVAIARALIGDPDLLIADEPTGELDSETGRRVLEVIEEVSDERAVVFASHDPAALAVADRTIGLRDGRVTANTTTPEDG